MTRPAPKNISVTPVFSSSLMPNFSHFMVSKERVVSLGARGLSLETVKTVGWARVRCLVRGPGSGDPGPGTRSPATARTQLGCPGGHRARLPSAAPLLPGRFLMRPVGLRKPPKTGWSQWVFSRWNAQVFSRLKTGTLRSRKIAIPMWKLHLWRGVTPQKCVRSWATELHTSCRSELT